MCPIIAERLQISRGKVICVEQPEIHLHPRLQAQLGDFLIDTTKMRDGNQWIVETHSELLIERIQRRIREGVLSSDDVSVLYVDPARARSKRIREAGLTEDERSTAGSVIKELRLGPDGSFVDAWPQGFFDENFQELMAFNQADRSNVIGDI